MRTAVFSDIHANLPALEKFVEKTKDKVDAYLCLGDIVNYGPWNDECIDMVFSLPGIKVLEGNHEALFLGKEPLDKEIELVQIFYSHSFPFFTHRDKINDLPEECMLGSFSCSHTVCNMRIYPDTQYTVDRNRFISHTHHMFKITSERGMLVNCGSIGQNRKEINVGNYIIYDDNAESVELCRYLYDFDIFIRELKARKYPECCINYYLGKKIAHESV